MSQVRVFGPGITREPGAPHLLLLETWDSTEAHPVILTVAVFHRGPRRAIFARWGGEAEGRTCFLLFARSITQAGCPIHSAHFAEWVGYL
jgi:hypothetical protein